MPDDPNDATAPAPTAPVLDYGRAARTPWIAERLKRFVSAALFYVAIGAGVGALVAAAISPAPVYQADTALVVGARATTTDDVADARAAVARLNAPETLARILQDARFHACPAGVSAEDLNSRLTIRRPAKARFILISFRYPDRVAVERVVEAAERAGLADLAAAGHPVHASPQPTIANRHADEYAAAGALAGALVGVLVAMTRVGRDARGREA